ncbi:MAG: TolC family protein [Planctomycetota bacterium]|jgi:outer membrane protein TolC|nr:TolC family protein [Planctomycetota bacterium]
MKKFFFWRAAAFFVLPCAATLADDAPAAPSAAFAAQVDAQSGIVADRATASLPQAPAVVVQSADELDRAYVPPAGVDHDYYAYTLNAAAVNGDTLSMSVLDAENMALAHSWKLRSAVEGRVAARGKKLGAIGGLLPSFGYETDLGYGQSYVDTMPKEPMPRASFSQTPSFTQPLFRGGALISALREARAGEDKAESDILYQRLTVRANIRQLYYQCMLNKKIADVARKLTDIAEEYWKKTQSRYAAEDVPEIDVLRYQVQYQLRKAEYINDRNNYNTSVTQLLRYLGQPLRSNVFLNDAFDFTEFDPGDEDELTQYALAHRPDLRSYQLNEEMMRQEVKQAKAGLLPTLDGKIGFTQGTSYAERNSMGGGGERYAGTWNWNMGIQLNWNALAGMGQQLRGKIMQANAVLAQAEFDTQDVADSIKQDVRNAVLGILSSVEAVKSQQENVEQANRVLTQENIRWEEGAGDYLQILDAQNVVGSAESSYWQSIYQYKTSIVNLEYALGKFYQGAGNEVQSYRVQKPAADNRNPLDALSTPQSLKRSQQGVSPKAAGIAKTPAIKETVANSHSVAAGKRAGETAVASYRVAAPVNAPTAPAPVAPTAAAANPAAIKAMSSTAGQTFFGGLKMPTAEKADNRELVAATMDPDLTAPAGGRGAPSLPEPEIE